MSPLLSNLVLDLLDKFVERHLIPRYTRGQRRQASRRHGALRVAACKARKNGDFERAKRLMPKPGGSRQGTQMTPTTAAYGRALRG